MRSHRIFSIYLILGLALVALTGASIAQEPRQASPVGTAITYQGRLAQNGQAVSATCAMTFRLYDHETAGSQIGPTLDQNVPLSDGLFTVSLDFGANVFDGQARWLEIAVQCPGDAAPTTLPRVALHAAPYAHYAQVAPWDGIQDMPPDFADGVDNDTRYRAGWGLRLQGTAFSVDERLIQSRVVTSCNASEAIRLINEDGTIECEPLQGPLTALHPLEVDNNTIWLNQGSGSGLDADTLDAKDSSEFLILAQDQTVSGSPTFANATPFAISHATLIPNLNAALLNGKSEATFFTLDEDEQVVGSPTFGNALPFSVTHATLIPNLNAEMLNGKGEASFFTLAENEQVTGSPTFGNAIPFSVTHATLVPNLNAELLSGKSEAHFFTLDEDEQVTGSPTFTNTTPFAVAHATLIPNLNAELLSGKGEASFFTLAENEQVTGSPTFNNVVPFSVTHATLIPNLNAQLLSGMAADQFFQLDRDGQVVSGTTTFAADVTFAGRPAFNGDNSGPPFTVVSTATVSGLDADTLDGQHASAFLTGADLSDYFNLTENETVVGDTTFDGTATFNAGVTFDQGVAFDATGQAPFTVQSAVKVTNLNADQLDGQDSSSYFQLSQNGQTVSGANTTWDGSVGFNSQPAFNATGQAPFTVQSALKVINLNADQLDGLDSTDYFQLDRDGQTVNGGNTTFSGTVAFRSRPAFNGDSTDAPFTVVSTQTVANLNADLLDGQEGAFYLDASNINTGTLNTDRFSAYDDLGAEGKLDNNDNGDLLTRYQSDRRYTRGCYAHRTADWAALNNNNWQSVPNTSCSISGAGSGALKMDSRTGVQVTVTGTANQQCQWWIGNGFGTQNPSASGGTSRALTCIIPSGETSATCTETLDVTSFKEVTTINSTRIWVRRFLNTGVSCSLTVTSAWNFTTFIPQ